MTELTTAALAADGSEVHTILTSKSGDGYQRNDLDMQGPSDRSDFGAVLSQQRDTLYVVGGVDAQNNPKMDLWSFDVGAQSWSSTAISQQGFGPERVLAASYAPAEDALIVLDRPYRIPIASIPYDRAG